MTDESQTPADQQVPPVVESGNIESPGRTAPLPVRIPANLLSLIDQECSRRGIVRSELVRQILTDHYQKPDTLTIPDEVYQALEQQRNQIQELTAQNAQLQHQAEQARSAITKLKEQHVDADLVAELENDLLKAVDIACKGIMCTRSDFRKKTKHYDRIERSRTH